MTSAEVQKAITDLGDINNWIREEAATKLRAEGKSVFFALVTTLDSSNSTQRREAARIIGKIAQDLANRTIIATEEELRRQLPTEVKELILALGTQDKSMRYAIEQELNRRRLEAFPLLLDALRNKTTERPDRIIRLLGEWGDLQAVVPLLDAWDTLGSANYLVIVDALRSLTGAAAQRPLELSDEELLRFIIFARQELGLHASQLGEALCRRVEARPSPSLRIFLPHLRGRWLHPVPESFESARQAILLATQDMVSLPIAAAGPDDTTGNLPMPVESDSGASSVNLPRPGQTRP
ncbi:MAG: hypothetical protein QM758_28025 [Armatimonas sp.]